MGKKMFVCAYCGSKWNYTTLKEFVCRKCGRRIAREELEEEKNKEMKIEEVNNG